MREKQAIDSVSDYGRKMEKLEKFQGKKHNQDGSRQKAGSAG